MDNVTTGRKYIVDISGKLPTILCEIGTSDGSLKKSYFGVYPGLDPGPMLRFWRSGPMRPTRIFMTSPTSCMTSLGSVKMVVDYNEVDAYAFVVNSYGYTPFGQDYARAG